jgi:hypothetical protein
MENTCTVGVINVRCPQRKENERFLNVMSDKVYMAMAICLLYAITPSSC